ncbi:MAG: alpha-L-rhamnosidase, partial [Frondihabitans sp.]|nr:alpha-L-rhamnosidase [Frondihabitans sp.]
MTSSVATLRAETRSDSTDVATPTPRLTWTTKSTSGDWAQAKAEIELDGAEVVERVGRESVLVAWPFAALSPRQTVSVRVRVTGRDGEISEWSEPVTITAGFLAAGEWSAPLVGLASPERKAQPALLRSEFQVVGPVRKATLYATAHGVYQAEINGVEVDDEILKPGWTAYRDRLVHETTDVTSLLVEGPNVIGVSLAGGWFTESFGFAGSAKPFYGSDPAVAAQLVIDYVDGGSVTVATGPEWLATGTSPVLDSSIYDGESYDARLETFGWSRPGFDTAGWTPVRVDGAPPVVPSARISPAVRSIQEVAVESVETSASGRQILDFGQNLVGRLRIRVQGEAGTVVTLRHAEVLENGELGIRPLRHAKATDSYTLRGGEEVWEPRFTFHGFRYAEVTGLSAPIDPADVTAVVIHSDMRRTGHFDSSNALLNRLHENVVWGMKGNFLSLPTDCPQRDERLGWTGDIQVFSPTASFLFDTDAFLSSWLVDLELEQKATGTGSVPFIIPSVLREAATPAAAWGDAATVVPTVLHERFGDLDVLRTQFESMKAWSDALLALSGDTYLWEGGFQFGDWLDPTAPPEDAARAATSPDIVASAYLYRSVRFTADAAALLDE